MKEYLRMKNDFWSTNAKKAVLCVCCIMLLGMYIGGKRQFIQFSTDENGMAFLVINIGKVSQNIFPWYCDVNGKYYFFIPTFVKDHTVNSDNTVYVDGRMITDEVPFKWEEDRVYTISSGECSYDVIFMQSANLDTLFITTQSGTLDEILQNKEHKETGTLDVISPNAELEYRGKLDWFSGRGNTTFIKEKCSYSLKLAEKGSLCGLEAGKRYNLLSLFFEHDKIHSKIVFDMAKCLGLEYTPECQWVDLYCNGNYQGLYLLTESINVADGRVEIYDLERENEKISSPRNVTGGYLLEKSIFDRIEEKESYFCTDVNNYYFAISSPSNITDTELEYIKNYVQTIENMISIDDERYWNYVDMDSFAKIYLIDKLFMENDAMWDGMYFYKDKESPVLKAGPVWDYDRSCGTILTDYTNDMSEAPNSMDGWYEHFYTDKNFKDAIVASYVKIQPDMERMLQIQIDEYVQYIDKSRKMDTVLVSGYSKGRTYSYEEYDSYIRYLKYFLANRMNYLNSLWNIENTYSLPPSSGILHEISFYDEDKNIIETQYVKDGSFVKNFPDVSGINGVWRFNSKKVYDSKIPVYENMKLYFKCEDDN